MSTLIGHQQQRQALAALTQEERLPSSLLFSGVEGIGKQQVAQELAKQLLCQGAVSAPQGGCATCKPCHLFDIGNHPDVHTLAFGDAGASVEDLRQTLERMSLRPFMGTRKVAIFNDADAMSIVGANIILKTLEEPRRDNFFILIASTPSRLPQTLLSRCQRWFFDRLSDQEVSAILRQRGASEEELRLAALADGSVGELDALTLQADIIDDVQSVIEGAWIGDTSRIARAAQNWGADKTGVRTRLAVLRSSIRQKLVENKHSAQAAAVWAHALQNALDAEYAILERHSNPTLVLFRILQSCNQSLATRYQVAPNSTLPILESLVS